MTATRTRCKPKRRQAVKPSPLDSDEAFTAFLAARAAECKNPRVASWLKALAMEGDRKEQQK